MLVRYLRPLKWRVLLLTACIAAGTGLELLIPKIMKGFIDGVIQEEGFEVLKVAAGAFVLVSIGRRVLTFATSYVSETLGVVGDQRDARRTDAILSRTGSRFSRGP